MACGAIYHQKANVTFFSIIICLHKFSYLKIGFNQTLLSTSFPWRSFETRLSILLERTPIPDLCSYGKILKLTKHSTLSNSPIFNWFSKDAPMSIRLKLNKIKKKNFYLHFIIDHDDNNAQHEQRAKKELIESEFNFCEGIFF